MKEPILQKATKRLLSDGKFAGLRKELDAFRKANTWVEDSALFYCLDHYDKELAGKAWWTWPGPLR